MNDAIETIEEAGFVANLHYDDDPSSPAEWDQLGTLVTWHRSYRWQEDGAKYFGTPADFLREAKREGWIYLPVAMIDHSGVSLYEGTHPHAFDAAGWDSGQVGFIYASRATFAKHVDSKLHRWRVRGIEVLRSELQTWDQYVQGQVYGYTIEAPPDEDGDREHVDSCWGFYGLVCAREELRAALGYAVKCEAEAVASVARSFAL